MDKISKNLKVLGNALDSVIKNQADMKEEISVLKKMIRRRDNKPEPGEKSRIPNLPIQSIEALEAFELELADEGIQTQLISHLAEIGGSKFTAVCHNIMKSLMTKEVAMLFSLQGKGSQGKRPFNKLKIYKCVLCKFSVIYKCVLSYKFKILWSCTSMV